MGAVNLPFNVVDGDPLDPSRMMADFQAITQVVNGGLEASTNVTVAAAVTQPGSANNAGVAATLARSDHQHIIQGFENLAADPATGNFRGRVYWNTATTELRYCTDPTGSGTYGSLTPTALELVVHAAQHKDGGHDPLPDNILTDHMFAAKGTIYSSTLSADTAQFGGSGWTNFGNSSDLVVTTTGLQTLGISVNVNFYNSGSGTPNAQFRVVDVTASNTTIFKGPVVQCEVAAQRPASAHFFYTTPAGGARTLRIQGTCSTASDVHAQQSNSVNTETLNMPVLQAVIL